jgi:hypothetical protein
MLVPLLRLSTFSQSNKSTTSDLIDRIPNAALTWRLSAVREVVFSGFQLDLYSAEEKAFAYWYASRLMGAHLAALEDMFSVVPEGG